MRIVDLQMYSGASENFRCKFQLVCHLPLCLLLSILDDTGKIDIDGPESSDYDQPDDDDNGGSINKQERRMVPMSILNRPGLLAGQLPISVVTVNIRCQKWVHK